MLTIVGTAAMIWVGGGILLHGLEGYGLPQIGHAIHAAAAGAAGVAGPLAGRSNGSSPRRAPASSVS